MFVCLSMRHQPLFKSKRQQFRKQIRRRYLHAKFKQLRKSLFRKCVLYEDIEQKIDMPGYPSINQEEKSQAYFSTQMRSLSQQLERYQNTDQDSHLAQIVRKSLKYLQKFEKSTTREWTDWDVKRFVEKIDGMIKYNIALQKWAIDEEQAKKQQKQDEVQSWRNDKAQNQSANSDHSNNDQLKQYSPDYADLQGLQSSRIDYHQHQEPFSPLILMKDILQFLLLQKLQNFLTTLSEQQNLPKLHFANYISQTLIVWLFFSTQNTNFFRKDRVLIGYRSQLNNNIVKDTVQMSRAVHELYFEVIEKVIGMMGLRRLTQVMFSSIYDLQSIGLLREDLFRKAGDTITCSPCQFMLAWQNKGIKVLKSILNAMEQHLSITQRELLTKNFETFVLSKATTSQTIDFLAFQEEFVKKAEALIAYLKKQINSRKIMGQDNLRQIDYQHID